jgi:hypothetical protein
MRLLHHLYDYIFNLLKWAKVFNAFDTNRDDHINFEEFLIGMSVMTRGSPDEKLDCKNIVQCLTFSSCIQTL